MSANLVCKELPPWYAHGDGREKERSDCSAMHSFGETMTVQSQAQDADLNVMLARMQVGMQMPVNPRIPTYGDFTGVSDFRSAFEAVKLAEEKFMEIPANVRALFQNDPQMYLDFCSDPGNLPRMRELGLAKPEIGHGGAGVAGSVGSSGADGKSSGVGAREDSAAASGGAAAGVKPAAASA